MIICCAVMYAISCGFAIQRLKHRDSYRWDMEHQQLGQEKDSYVEKVTKSARPSSKAVVACSVRVRQQILSQEALCLMSNTLHITRTKTQRTDKTRNVHTPKKKSRLCVCKVLRSFALDILINLKKYARAQTHSHAMTPPTIEYANHQKYPLCAGIFNFFFFLNNGRGRQEK